MKWELNVHNTLIIPRLSLQLLGCYPIKKDAGRVAYLQQQFFWWINMVIATYNITWILNNIVQNATDINLIIKVSPEVSLVLSQMGKQLTCKFQHDNFRDILDEFERFLTEAPPAMLDRFHRELRSVLIIHTIFIFGCIVDPIFYTFTPLIDGRPLPAHAKYPWSLNSTAVYIGMYTVQLAGTMSVSWMANMDVMFLTLMWYAVIRFRYLNSWIIQAKSAMNLREYAAQQQRIIKYCENLANIARWMAFIIVMEIFYMVTTGGVLILNDPPAHELFIYATMALDGALELLLYCWAADNLCDASQDLGYAAFQCDWYGKSREMVLNQRLIMQRCQRPVTISSPGILPELKMEFFGSIMSTTFSYIATVRAVYSS